MKYLMNNTIFTVDQIETKYEWCIIPSHDWKAYFKDHEPEAIFDQEGCIDEHNGYHCGHGGTKEEAIKDLLLLCDEVEDETEK